MFFLIHGDNEFEISERVADFKQKIGDDSMRDLNITVLDGRKTTLGEVQHAADSIPFLADKRLVIVEGLLTRLASRKAKDSTDEAAPSGAAKDFLNGLVDYVPRLPDTTRLVFVEFQPLNAKHPLIKLAEQQKGKTNIACPQPVAGELPRWITDRAKKHGGSIEFAAAQRLAVLIGGDLRRLDTEINKLSTYVNAQRSITEKDVNLLVSDASTSSVFDLVDALGKREGKRAAHELHHLLDQGENPLGLAGDDRAAVPAADSGEGNAGPQSVAGCDGQRTGAASVCDQEDQRAGAPLSGHRAIRGDLSSLAGDRDGDQDRTDR